METKRILISWDMEDYFVRILESELESIKDHNLELIDPKTRDKGILKPIINDAYILLAGVADIDLLECGRNLGLIQSLTAGVGRIDLTYTSRRGIPVCSAKGCNSITVAEHTLMLMLMLSRRAKQIFSKSEWLYQKPDMTELYGKKIGILGAGHTGTEVAKRCKLMGMTTYGIDKYPHERPFRTENKVFFDGILDVSQLHGILPNIDFLTIHVPKTPETNKIISAPELMLMKPTSYVINMARGTVVELNDLNYALRNGWIRGAAVDVFSQEPPDYSHPIFECNNFIFTPHSGGRSRESRGRLAEFVYKNLENFLYGRPLMNLVSPNLGF